VTDPLGGSTSPYVFLSYASADRERALHIAELLEAQGISIWIDRKSIAGGTSWSAEIVSGIESSSALVILCTVGAMTSPNVQQEVQLAWEGRKPILPLLLEKVQLPNVLRYALAGRQWIEVLDHPDADWLPAAARGLRGLGIKPDPPGSGDTAPLTRTTSIADAAASPTEDDLPRHNLPVQVSSFVGRARELAEVSERLAETHLLTLTGAGGCEKTRLALQVAANQLESYPDGVWFVDLAPLTDPTLVLPTVIATLGVADVPGRLPLVVLGDYLRRRIALLVRDNCEHLIDACARLIEVLLQRCPHLRIVATSREALGVAGEIAWRVPSLSLPDPQQPTSVAELGRSEAIQLFVQRARLVQPGFALTEEVAGAVAQICRRLDGIPFAIELAAARLRILTVEQIATRLDDRFGLLTGGRRTALRRQQTLRALVDWSYDLLTDGERRLLRRLAVFAGGWTLEAAEAVCSGDGIEAYDVLDLLTGLADKSLVVADQQGRGERYRLLETLRQYAEEKMVEAGEAVAVRDHHRDWIVALAERAAIEGDGPVAVDWSDRLLAERDNLRAALAWSQTQGPGAAVGLRLTLHLSGLAEWTSFRRGEDTREALEWLRIFLELAPTPNATRGLALTEGAVAARLAGDSDRSLAYAEEAVAIFRDLSDDVGASDAVAQIGLTLAEDGEYAKGVERLEESVTLVRTGASKRMLANRLRDLGLVLTSAANLSGARAALEESLEIGRALGFYFGLSRGLLHLGNVYRVEGNLVQAQECFDQRLALEKRVAPGRATGVAPDIDFQISRALLAAAQGDRAGVRRALNERLRSHWRRGDSRWSGTLLCAMEVLAVMGQKASPGVQFIGAGAAANPRYATVLFPSMRLDVERSLATAKASLGEQAFAVAWSSGQAMTLEQAVTFALEDDSNQTTDKQPSWSETE
jgi:predicted ATPase